MVGVSLSFLASFVAEEGGGFSCKPRWCMARQEIAGALTHWLRYNFRHTPPSLCNSVTNTLFTDPNKYGMTADVCKGPGELFTRVLAGRQFL